MSTRGGSNYNEYPQSTYELEAWDFGYNATENPGPDQTADEVVP